MSESHKDHFQVMVFMNGAYVLSDLTMTLLCATGTSSNVFTLRGRLLLSLCWDSLHIEKTGSEHLPQSTLIVCGKCSLIVSRSLSNKYKVIVTVTGGNIMLTRGTAGYHSAAEPPESPHPEVCCRGSWGQESRGIPLPHLLSVGCSPSHPGDRGAQSQEAN